MLLGRYDFPSPIIFLALLGLSSLMGLAGGGQTTAGFLLLLWSILGLCRFLWALETNFLLHDANIPQKSKFLPWLILSGMDLRARLDAGFRVLRAADTLGVLWFALSFVYAFWSLYVALFPAPPGAFYVASALIRNFYSAYFSGARDFYFALSLAGWAAHIAVPAVCMLSFWLARSYALSLENSRMLFGFCLTIFVLSALAGSALSGWADGPLYRSGSWKGYGFTQSDPFFGSDAQGGAHPSGYYGRTAEVGIGGAVFMLLPCVLVAMAMIRNVMQNRPRRYYALGGVFVMAVMLYFDLKVRGGAYLWGVYIGGWALAGVLFQASISSSRRIYTPRLA